MKVTVCLFVDATKIYPEIKKYLVFNKYFKGFHS